MGRCRGVLPARDTALHAARHLPESCFLATGGIGGGSGVIGVQPYRRTTAHAASSQAVGASGARRRSYGDIGDIGGSRGRGAEAARGKLQRLQENFGYKWLITSE